MEKTMNETTQEFRPSITFLDGSGDVTLTWDEDSEATILKFVEEKMRQGIAFFILEQRKLGPIPLGTKKVNVSSVEQAKAAGAVSLTDDEARKAMGLRPNLTVVNGNPQKASVTQLPKVKALVDDKYVGNLVNSGQARITQTPHQVQTTTVGTAKTAQEAVQSRTIAVRKVVGG